MKQEIVFGVLALVAAAWTSSCSGDDLAVTGDPADGGGAALDDDTGAPPTSSDPTPTPSDAGADTEAPQRPISVDRKNPKRYDFTFKANQADPAANESLGTQAAYLDTRVESVGKLVVYLHGSGDTAPTSCANAPIADLLAPKGFHVFTPCYNSYYGVGKCGDDIGGCRLEAFEGVDHTKVIDIKPANAIEPRIVAAISYLVSKHPGGDWGYFLDGDKPRWKNIIIAGISHGASSSGIIGVVRDVDRVVMLSGPLDTNQAWLARKPITNIDRFFAFSHTADTQHPGHLAAFATMMLPGNPTSVDGAKAPYGGSHRLISSAATTSGHGATQPGAASPRTGTKYVYAPVWAYLFGR